MDDTTSPPPKARASEKDRDYFRRLGEWEAENDRIERAEHQARSLEERLAFSWTLTRRFGRSLNADANDDNGTSVLFARARRFGCYRA